MRYVIVTGMSGAGKSTALNVLEDDGYYCVDNLPIQLIPKFTELALSGKPDVSKAAIGVDIRSGAYLMQMEEILRNFEENEIEYEILFLDASNECLVKRYKETRRNHPLAANGRIEDGIIVEREKMQFLKEHANYILDTSMLLTRELKSEIEKIFLQGEAFNSMFVNVMSFGFKYGIPSDADLVFDVRFLPNPYYVDELRPMSGNDAPVRDFVMNAEITQEFAKKLVDMIRFLIPNYVKEGKTQLVIAIGCTGGRHRSVTLTNLLGEALKGGDYGLKVTHRDITGDTKRQ